MRFSVFVALLVATLVACCSSFSSAEDLSVPTKNGNNVRRLQKIPGAAVDAISGQADDLLLKHAMKTINAANGDKAAIKKAINMATLGRAAAKLGDDDVAKMLTMVKEAKGDEAHAMRFILGFSKKEGKVITDESTAAVSTKIAETVVKSPKSWPKLRKFTKIALGTTVGALAIYGAYKLMFSSKSQGAPTTTTGSA